MTDKEQYQTSLTEQVAANAAAFASNMRSVYEGLPTEVMAQATAAFTEQYALYWIRKVESGETSFMDTDFEYEGGNGSDR